MRVFCPAKVNLFLHVTGKRDNGYHDLQSLICFTDFGDYLEVKNSDQYTLDIEGPFSKNCGSTENNLITKAVRSLEEITNQTMDFSIKLEKNTPVGAGLGGGSANAAAIVKILLDHSRIDITDNILNKLLLSLGADVPVCYEGQTAFVEGVGEIVQPLLSLSQTLTLLLVFPNAPVPTQNVFSKIEPPYSNKIVIEKELSSDYLSLIQRTKNDLTPSAINEQPLIQNVLKALSSYPDCLLSRMTGSGSCCFGIFKNQESAQKAEEFFKKQYKDWWVRAVTAQL